jgi:hypothetical protein
MEMRSLDHYIKDSDVVSVIKGVMMRPVPPHDWSDWATNNPVEVPRFFSRPYPVVAVRLLGYTNDNMTDNSNIQYAPGFNPPVEEPSDGEEQDGAVNYIVNEETVGDERTENIDQSR